MFNLVSMHILPPKAILPILFSFILLFSCERSVPQTTTFTGNAMTIDFKIIVGDSLSSEREKQALHIIHDTFEEVNTIYNKWNPDSELSKLNRLEAGKVILISTKLEKLLLLSEKINQLSEGRFDPTIEPLQALWKKKLQNSQIPTEEEIAKIQHAVGWDKLHFGHGFFYKNHSLTSLDLGGIAKGLCVDLLIEKLNQAGFPNVFVEWGGEIRTAGQHPDFRPWKVGISNLGNLNQELSYVDMQNAALATSGDYFQRWNYNNKTFFHIFDPKTLKPLESSPTSVASATVLASTCAYADGLATAAMMFPTLESAEQWLKSIQEKEPNLQFWLLKR